MSKERPGDVFRDLLSSYAAETGRGDNGEERPDVDAFSRRFESALARLMREYFDRGMQAATRAIKHEFERDEGVVKK